MMNFDLLIAALLIILGLLGLVSGAIRQLTHWAALALAYILAWPLASRLTPVLAPKLSLPPAAVKIILSSLGFFGLYALGAVVFHLILAKLAGNRENGRWDHAGGFLLGLGKGTVIVFVALSVAVYFEKPLTQALGRPPAAVENSRTVAFVRRHNLFDSVPAPILAKIEKLAAAARDPESGQSLESLEPELKGLLKDPHVQSLLKDGNLDQILKSGDISALKNDPRFSALLKDPRITEGLSTKSEDIPQ